ncbi:272_t:CDS:2 [Ambispora leptoticha]|uniref:272_t:CDS:1 n=1 Tax=Ambispora leptoticha TaxID=144679 RepID=A0A9N8WIK0_9GLOM|nr:272_t:CDS:2 [Ambispora leptoticha]
MLCDKEEGEDDNIGTSKKSKRRRTPSFIIYKYENIINEEDNELSEEMNVVAVDDEDVAAVVSDPFESSYNEYLDSKKSNSVLIISSSVIISDSPSSCSLTDFRPTRPN